MQDVYSDSSSSTGTDSSNKGKAKRSKVRISNEARKVIVNCIENGSCSRREAAEKFNVSYNDVVAIHKKFLETGKTVKVGTSKTKRQTRTLTNEHKEFLLKKMEENCQYPMKKLRIFFAEKFAIDVCDSTISRSIPTFLFNVNIVQKVKLTVLTAEQILERQTYCEHFTRANKSNRLIIYFGQADLSITMRQMGRRETAGVGPENINPFIKHRNKTIMMAVTNKQRLHYKVVNELRNNSNVLEYFEELCWLLTKKGLLGSVIIIDDLIFSQYPEIKGKIENAGLLILILTENCQFLNPTENIFSDLLKYIKCQNPRSELTMNSVINSFGVMITTDVCSKYSQQAIDDAHNYLGDN